MSLAFKFDHGLNGVYPAAIAAWKAHALSVGGVNEACGFILADGTFMPAENVSTEPARNFAICKRDLDRAGEYRAILHSHTPDAPEPGTNRVDLVKPDPSKADMEYQIQTAVPWGISTCDGEQVSDPLWWGDTLPIRPLIGRNFIHGVSDCYSLVRDWHRMRGIVFDDVPRDDQWWTQKGQDLYIEGFEKAGFHRVDRRHPLPGDCFICAIRSPVFNHAGVYTGKGMILHHFSGHFSMETNANRYQQKMTFLVRHKDLEEYADA